MVARVGIRQGLELCIYEQQCGGGGERISCMTSLVTSSKLVSSVSCLALPSG